MKNTVKRIFSCLSVLAICLMSNISVQAKSVTSSIMPNVIQSKQNKEISTQQNFILYHGATIDEAQSDKLAGHYSHRSHYSHSSHSSHHSHYSSRY